MELDLYLPSLNLAFEYQGIQHYEDFFLFGTLSKLYEERDQEKRKMCSKFNITLIEIPYWWDEKKESLMATINQIRSGLVNLPKDVKPIPLIQPKKKGKPNDISELLMLAKIWKEEDPTGWWISEKLDGIRAFWDGSKFYTKLGNEIWVPKFITNSLPKIALDGEFWMGRGRFDQIINISKSRDEEIWRDVKYCIFDLPKSKNPYEERLAFMRQLKNGLSRNIKIVDSIKCTGLQHLQDMYKQVISSGGEGLVLRRPNSNYEVGRSSSFLKLKPYLDCEVKFLEKAENSFLCEQPNGHTCLVQCDYQTLSDLPAPGAVITITHEGFWKTGKLKNPQFLRVRPDLLWSIVLEEHFEGNKKIQS